MKSLITGLSHRAGWATTLTLISWIAVGKDLGNSPDVQSAIAHILNWPISTAALLFPSWGGINLFYKATTCEFCTFWWFLRQHLLLGIPVYVGLLYLPNAIAAGVRYIRERRLSTGRMVNR